MWQQGELYPPNAELSYWGTCRNSHTAWHLPGKSLLGTAAQPQPTSREAPRVCSVLQPSLLCPPAAAVALVPSGAGQCPSMLLTCAARLGPVGDDWLGTAPPQPPLTLCLQCSFPSKTALTRGKPTPFITMHHLHSQDLTTHIPGRKILLSTECLSASLWHCKNNNFWTRMIIHSIPNQHQRRPRPEVHFQETAMPCTEFPNSLYSSASFAVQESLGNQSVPCSSKQEH